MIHNQRHRRLLQINTDVMAFEPDVGWREKIKVVFLLHGDRPFAMASINSRWRGLFFYDVRTEWRSHSSENAIVSALAIKPF